MNQGRPGLALESQGEGDPGRLSNTRAETPGAGGLRCFRPAESSERLIGEGQRLPDLVCDYWTQTPAAEAAHNGIVSSVPARWR